MTADDRQRRTPPFPRHALRVLRGQAAADLGKKCPPEAFRPDEVVEGPTKGGMQRSASVRSWLKRRAGLAGITRGVHPHGFRHTLAAELAHEGVSLVHIQRQLGHPSLAVTAAYLSGIAAGPH